jgi:thiamine-monophosphate kinase
MNSPILEHMQLEMLTRYFHRSPHQLNKINESDAEIVEYDSPIFPKLAITTDSIVEEIQSGLYSDPYLIGWMTVMANMSDLAAVGAVPLGILVSEVLPEMLSNESLEELQKGISDACDACGTFVIGGDTNTGDLLLTGCAFGTIEKDYLLSRVGARPGDQLYCTGLLGQGNAFALNHILSQMNGKENSSIYQPCARLREGQLLAGIASSCMDTSDGTLATLDQLMRINHVGFDITQKIGTILDPRAFQSALSANLPPWIMLAGQHGEFELLITVPEKNLEDLRGASKSLQWKPIFLGEVIAEQEIRLRLDDSLVVIDTGYIRNLAITCGNNIRRYIQELCEYDATLQKGVLHHVIS